MSFLQINNLSKSFDSKIPILKDINISIAKGEFLVLLGPSGCGKSTLLNCIAGLLNFNEGDIFINDRNMNKVHPSRRDIAMVFQSYALYPNMSVKKNISFGMKIRKENKKTIATKIQEVAKVLNIEEILNRKPSQLSGGQQQRVAIARALVRNPLLFLFDEPLSNLDAKLRVKMRTEIKKLHKQLQVTIVYVTHDQIEAMTLADKIAIVDKGEIKQFGSPKNIYFKPNSTFVARFIGTPPMNLLSGILKSKNNQLSFVLGKNALTIPTEKISEELKKQIGEEIILGIRPEDVHPHKQSSSSQWEIPISVSLIEPQGADNLIVANLEGQEIIGRHHNSFFINEEKINRFYLNTEKILFFDKKTKKVII